MIRRFGARLWDYLVGDARNYDHDGDGLLWDSRW